MITEQQRLDRMNSIGGSDAPILYGLSPYKTAYRLWQEKVGEAEPDDLSDNEAVTWGNVLEEVVADEFSRRSGLTLHRVNKTLRHPEHAFMTGHIDRRVVGQPALVEIKTVRALDGDAIRPDHGAQVQHYLAVTGYREAHVVYLVAGQRLANFKVERDDDFIGNLIERELDFWQHVTTRTPPPPQTVADLRLAFPNDAGQVITADGDTLAAVERLRQYSTERKRIEALEEVDQAAIMGVMGEASELINSEGKTVVTWKAAKPTRSFDAKRFQSEHPDLAINYMIERPGSRRFLLKEKV